MAADQAAEHEVVFRDRVQLLPSTAAWIAGVGLMAMARSRVDAERDLRRAAAARPRTIPAGAAGTTPPPLGTHPPRPQQGGSAMPTCTTQAVPAAIATGTTARSGAQRVELRPLRPDDSAAVLAVFDGMGSHSRELRFLASKTRLTEADLRHLTAVDGCNHVGVVAVARPARPIGIARFIRDRHDHDSAEVAVEVVDEWQDQGVGTRLLLELRQHAVDAGVRRFKVFVSPDNSAARRLLARTPDAVTTLSTDRWMTEYVVSLDRWEAIWFRASGRRCRATVSR